LNVINSKLDTIMEYKLASIFKRFIALVIDGIILSIAVRILSFPFNFPSYDSGFAFIRHYGGIFFFVALAYYAFFESSDMQATLGKKVMNLKVFDEAGNKLTAGKAIVRNFVKIISGNYFIIGFIVALFTKNKQALHDIVASTVVVED